jgi:D-alanine-D-alanine ligase
MEPILLFGGTSRERLVSVASAQSLAVILPNARLWFWADGDTFTEVRRDELLAHTRPFEIPFRPGGAPFAGDVGAMLDAALAAGQVLLLALHGGESEDGTFAARCEARRVPFTGSGSAASRAAFDKRTAKTLARSKGLRVAPALELASAAEATDGRVADWLAKHGRLVAKPAADGSSYGLLFVDGLDALPRLAELAAAEAYVVEPFLRGVEATVAVTEWDPGAEALPPVEIRPVPGRAFDYAGKYLGQGVSEICPAELPEADLEALRRAGLIAHEAIGAYGYSRTDFIVTADGPVFLELNTLPGLTRTSLFPLALETAGHAMADFLAVQQRLAKKRAAETPVRTSA